MLAATWCGQLLPMLAGHSRVVIAMISARACVAILQGSAGVMLAERRPLGYPLGQVALVASAALRVLELGARLSPSSVFPSYRWPVVLGYALYAAAVYHLLLRGRRRVE